MIVYNSTATTSERGALCLRAAIQSVLVLPMRVSYASVITALSVLLERLATTQWCIGLLKAGCASGKDATRLSTWAGAIARRIGTRFGMMTRLIQCARSKDALLGRLAAASATCITNGNTLVRKTWPVSADLAGKERSLILATGLSQSAESETWSTEHSGLLPMAPSRRGEWYTTSMGTNWITAWRIWN